MDRSPIIDSNPPKPTKTPAHLRKAQILALQTAGWTQDMIAAHFGVNRSTIVKDLQDLQPAREQVENALSQLVSAIDSVHSIEDSALNYADLAASAKNEAVRLAAEDRITDFRGIVTEKERIRAKRDEPGTAGPMFVFNGGLNIDFGGGAKPQHIVDVAPETDTHTDDQK